MLHSNMSKKKIQRKKLSNAVITVTRFELVKMVNLAHILQTFKKTIIFFYFKK